MARDGSGTYSLPSGNPVTTGTTISSTTHNNTMSDIASALTASVAKDGQTTMTANLPMGGFKLTNLAAGSASTDSVRLGQLQGETGVYVSTVGGTADAITLTPSPAITAYAAGQRFSFIASGANTTAVTVAISGLSAQAVTKNGSTALVAGDIPSGALVVIHYDGTRFQLIGGVPNAVLTSGTQTVAGDKTLSGNNTQTGTLTMSAKSLWMAEGADVPSANDCNIWEDVDGNTVHISGTTEIQDWGTAPQAGASMWVIFDGALQLTYNATTNKLNTGGKNYTTVAGDRALVYAETTTSFVVTLFPLNRSLSIFSETAVTASGTSVTFSSIPQWVREISICWSGISWGGADTAWIQIGDSGGVENTGYTGAAISVTDGGTSAYSASTSAWIVGATADAGDLFDGQVTLKKLASNTWTISGSSWRDSTTDVGYSISGKKALSAELDRVVFTTSGGATFDAGDVNIFYS